MKWQVGLWTILTLRCEGAAALASRELDEPLSLAERLALRGHLLACRSCRVFRRQLRMIRDAARCGGGGDRGRDPVVVRNGPERHLSPEARARIEQALRDAEGETAPDDGP